MSGKDANWNERREKPFVPFLEKWGRRLLYRLVSSCLPDRNHPSTFSLEKVQRILLIKEPYRMGDLIQVTPTLRALRRRFPSLYSALLIQDRNLPIFRHNPDVNEIFVYEKRRFNRNPFALLSFLRRIRRSRFDLAVTLETQRTHLTNDLFAFFSGASRRLRYDGGAFGNPESNAFYNLLAAFEPASEHEVERNFAVFRRFGLALDDRRLALRLSDDERRRAQEILRGVSKSGERLTVIHPGSYKLGNRWPLERYLELAARIRGDGKEVLFLLGPSEREWLPRIKKEGFSVLDSITIPEMAGILERSRLVVCNDTGVMHIAAAVGARTLALFGETEPLRWQPPGEHVKALRADDRRMESISVAAVYEAARSVP